MAYLDHLDPFWCEYTETVMRLEVNGRLMMGGNEFAKMARKSADLSYLDNLILIELSEMYCRQRFLAIQHESKHRNLV